MILDCWVIYEKPNDFPDLFVARCWLINSHTNSAMPTETVKTAATLNELRREIPSGYHCVPRYNEDDPNIVEIWL